MGKQNTPLILGFVNNAARNTFNVSQKQVQNRSGQQKAVKQQKPQQQGWTVVNNKKANTKSFQSWADVASRNTKSELQKQSTVKPQQRSKTVQQQKPKQVQKQQPQKAKQQQPQQKKNTKSQQTQTTWGWYPASKQEAELKKLRQKASKKMQGKQGKQQPMKQKSKQQKMRIAAIISNRAKIEAQELKRAQQQKRDYALLKNVNSVYDGFSYTFPLQNSRNAWISTNKVGGNKVMSVATLFAIKYAPTVRGNKKPFVQRSGKIIFNNKCIRRAVEGKFTGHKKFRGNRVLTYIPEKWFSKENGYAKGANYDKYANLNEIKRNERCYSFKGVY